MKQLLLQNNNGKISKSHIETPKNQNKFSSTPQGLVTHTYYHGQKRPGLLLENPSRVSDINYSFQFSYLI